MTANQKDMLFYIIVGMVLFALLYTIVGRVS